MLNRLLSIGSFVSNTRDEAALNANTEPAVSPSDYCSIAGYSPFDSYSIAGQTHTGLAPLMYLATHQPTAVVEDWLIEHHHQLDMVNAEPTTALNLACQSYPLSCSFETIELLLQFGAKFGTDPGDSSTTSLGLSTSSRSSSKSLAHPLTLVYKSNISSEANKIELADLLIRHGALKDMPKGLAVTLITNAIDTGIPTLVEQLVEGGLDVNTKWGGNDGTPLIYSINKLKPTMTAALIDLGADVNLANRRDCSPFAVALALGSTRGKVFVDLILTRKAPVKPEIPVIDAVPVKQEIQTPDAVPIKQEIPVSDAPL